MTLGSEVRAKDVLSLVLLLAAAPEPCFGGEAAQASASPGAPRAAMTEYPPSGSGRSFRDCPDCPEMVVIPPGRFTMGSPSHEAERRISEGPPRRVTIGYPLAVGKYPVTFAEWDACVASGGCNGHRPDDMGWGRERQPVINVNWDDAQAYVRWLAARTGRSYRLLSEAEWEYAARAGTTTARWWGEEAGRFRANYGFGVGRTTPVDRYPANPWGLHDVLGNAMEWVADCWNRNYARAPSDGSAWESGDCRRRVLRGGSWNNSSRLVRAANRSGVLSGDRLGFAGFRMARTLD